MPDIVGITTWLFIIGFVEKFLVIGSIAVVLFLIWYFLRKK